MLIIDSVQKYAWQRRDRDRRTKSRIYFWPKGETIMENLVEGRWNRPYEAYRTLLPQVFSELGVEPVKARWSQKAGCSCGCSPGFILDDMLSTSYSSWDAYDVSVDVVEVTNIEQYAALLNVTYVGDVDPRHGGMFIASRGEGDDHMNVLRLSEGEDRLYIECLTALTHGGWEADSYSAAMALGHSEGVLTDIERAEAVVTYGHPVDPMQPGHAFDDFRYNKLIPYDDVPDDDEKLMEMLIPFVDRILP